MKQRITFGSIVLLSFALSMPLLVSCDKDELESLTSATSLNGHEYVDLGLSVKWATCNIGADSPSRPGDFFAWAATKPLYKPGFALSEEPEWNGYTTGYSKTGSPYYCFYLDFAKDFSEDGIIDAWKRYYPAGAKYDFYEKSDSHWNDTRLVSEDDAASVNWGDKWRMPTKSEFEELLDTGKCVVEPFLYDDEAVLGGEYGIKITSKVPGYEGNFILLPTSGGVRQDEEILYVPGTTFYWTGDLDISNPSYDSYCKKAWTLGFVLNIPFATSADRYVGIQVRPVFK